MDTAMKKMPKVARMTGLSLESKVKWLILVVCDVGVDLLVLAASLEVLDPPGLLLAEALACLGPMVLLDGDDQQ